MVSVCQVEPLKLNFETSNVIGKKNENLKIFCKRHEAGCAGSGGGESRLLRRRGKGGAAEGDECTEGMKWFRGRDRKRQYGQRTAEQG